MIIEILDFEDQLLLLVILVILISVLTFLIISKIDYLKM